VLAPVVGVTVVDWERTIARLAPQLAQRDEPIRPVVGERREQDPVDDGKDGCGRADSQRERKDDGQRVGAIVPEGAEYVAEVEGQGSHAPLTEQPGPELSAGQTLTRRDAYPFSRYAGRRGRPQWRIIGASELTRASPLIIDELPPLVVSTILVTSFSGQLLAKGDRTI
jgi:hypothetical protein